MREFKLSRATRIPARHAGASDPIQLAPLDDLDGSVRVVVLVGFAATFSAFAFGLAESLARHGAEVDVRMPTEGVGDADIAIAVGLHRFSTPLLRRVRRSAILVGIQTEQLTTPAQGAGRYGAKHRASVLRNIRQVDVAIDWHRENLVVLRRHHRNVHAVPYGLVEADQFSPRSEPPSYDLAFVGHVDALDGRRRKILHQLSHRFVVHPTFEGAWGADKFAVFSRSRIVLNLHVEASAVFESPRFYDVLGARRPLISEPVHDPWPFQRDVDYCETTVFTLEREIDRLLANEFERERLVAAGRQRVDEHSMDASAASLLRLALVAHQNRSVR